MTMVDPQAAQIVMGPPKFVTISTVLFRATGTTFTLEFDTDQLVQLTLNWTRMDPPADPGTGGVSGSATDPAATLHHVLTATGGLSPGQLLMLTLNLAATDVSGLLLRPYVTQQRTGNVRMPAPVAGRSVPVRFYQFGGTPPPPAGGGTPPAAGNWNTYIWAQYNPKGTAFPT